MAIRDKIAGGKAILEAAERVGEFIVDPPIEAIIDKIAGERVEEFTVDPSIEATIDKIAGGEAILDKIARGEAACDKTAEEGKAILEATERVDEEVEGPRIESRPR